MFRFSMMFIKKNMNKPLKIGCIFHLSRNSFNESVMISH